MKRKLMTGATLGITSLMLAACGPTSTNENSTAQTEESSQETQTETISYEVESDVTNAIETAESSVVTILNMQGAQEDPLSSIFGVPSQNSESEGEGEGEFTQAGTGSGAVYKVDGDQAYIFTNNHVIEGADAIDVLLHNGERVQAEVVGSDDWTDLAVLSIDSEHVDSTVEFGDSDALTVGEPAIAIGSPLGSEFASSATQGIVSGVNRAVPVDVDGDGQLDWEMNSIQTDAAINPGNSGGPLINIAGQVIGINSMKVSSDVVEGMGFAIPSNDAQNIIAQLEENGEVVRPSLGVTMIDVALLSDEQREESLQIDPEQTSGVLIVDVSANSPADEAGIQTGDVITTFNGVNVENGTQLRQEIYRTQVGQEVEVEYIRDGETHTATMTMQQSENLDI